MFLYGINLFLFYLLSTFKISLVVYIYILSCRDGLSFITSLSSMKTCLSGSLNRYSNRLCLSSRRAEGNANYNGDKAIINYKDEYDQQCKMTIQKTKTAYY